MHRDMVCKCKHRSCNVSTYYSVTLKTPPVCSSALYVHNSRDHRHIWPERADHFVCMSGDLAGTGRAGRRGGSGGESLASPRLIRPCYADRTASGARPTGHQRGPAAACERISADR